MRKPTPKQIGEKKTWSPADEAELREGLTRVKSDYSRLVMLVRRARSITLAHPEAAIALFEECLSVYADQADHQIREAVLGLALASVKAETPEIGAARHKQFTQDMLAQNPKNVDPIMQYLIFVVAQQITAHYQSVIELVPQIEHDEPSLERPRVNNITASWQMFTGAAYLADLMGDTDKKAHFLEKARTLQDQPNMRPPEAWRLWLFQEAKMGARSVTDVLVQPDFQLSEMRDWAEKTFKAFKPEIDYGPSKFGERLCLSWDDFCVDLIILDSEKRARMHMSYFTKKRLGKFDTDGVKALFWGDAGNVDDPDAINTSIQILDYFQKDPRIIVNMG